MNRYTMTFVTVAAVLTLLPLAAGAGVLGPSNYDECILEHMKGVGDRAAAGAIMQACAAKFPKKKPVAKAEPPQPDKLIFPDSNGFTNVIPYDPGTRSDGRPRVCTYDGKQTTCE
jgi:hypothetical protein